MESNRKINHLMLCLLLRHWHCTASAGFCDFDGNFDQTCIQDVQQGICI